MKKRLAILCLLALTLSSCTSINRLGELLQMKKEQDEQATKNQAVQVVMPDEAVDALVEDGFERVETPTDDAASAWDFTEYSLEELLDGLTNRTPIVSTPPVADPELPEGTVDGTTVTFSDETWEEKGVEEVDITQYMTPEEKAELDAMNEEEMAAAMAEMESSMQELVDSFGGNATPTPEGTPDPDPTTDPSISDVDIDAYYKQYEDALKDALDMFKDTDLGGLLGGFDISGMLP